MQPLLRHRLVPQAKALSRPVRRLFRILRRPVRRLLRILRRPVRRLLRALCPLHRCCRRHSPPATRFLRRW